MQFFVPPYFSNKSLLFVCLFVCVFCIRSCVTRCTLLMVLYLDHMRQCGLLPMLWSHIGTRTRRTFILLSMSLWNDLANPEFDGVGLAVSRAGPMLSYWPKLLYTLYNLPLFFPFSYFCLQVGIMGRSLRTDRVYIIPSLSLALPTFNNNNNNNNNKVAVEISCETHSTSSLFSGAYSTEKWLQQYILFNVEQCTDF